MTHRLTPPARAAGTCGRSGITPGTPGSCSGCSLTNSGRFAVGYTGRDDEKPVLDCPRILLDLHARIGQPLHDPAAADTPTAARVR